MEVTKEMLERHQAGQQAANEVAEALAGLTLVEALGVIELVKAGLLKYSDSYDIDTGVAH